MKEALANLRKQFPSLPRKSLMKVYKARLEQMRLLMIKDIPTDIRWIIEARVRLAGESSDSFISYMSGLRKNIYAKKKRVKKMGVCYKYARMICNTRCRSSEMMSDNREDKIKFIRDCMSKESLDDISLTLEMYPSGYVYHVIHMLYTQFRKERP